MGSQGTSGTDCRVIDFNFMFSRKCDGCVAGENSSAGCRHHETDTDEELLQFATDDERNVLRNYGGQQPAQFWTPHPTQRRRMLYGMNSGWNEGRLSLRREHSLPGGAAAGAAADQRHYDVPRATGRFAREQFLNPSSSSGRAKSDHSPNMNAGRSSQNNWTGNSDPFRNWELNVENNTFKPANNRVQDVRRITDGTYRRKEVRDATRVPGQPSSLATDAVGVTAAQAGPSGLGKFKFSSQGSEATTEEDEEANEEQQEIVVEVNGETGEEVVLKRSSECEDGSGSSLGISTDFGSSSTTVADCSSAVVVGGDDKELEAVASFPSDRVDTGIKESIVVAMRQEQPEAELQERESGDVSNGEGVKEEDGIVGAGGVRENVESASGDEVGKRRDDE